MEGRDADGALDRLGDALRSALDASVQLVPRSGATRHCTTARCLCGHEVWREGHVTALGHGSLDQAFDVLLEKVCSHISTTPCSRARRNVGLPSERCVTQTLVANDSSCRRHPSMTRSLLFVVVLLQLQAKGTALSLLRLHGTLDSPLHVCRRHIALGTPEVFE